MAGMAVQMLHHVMRVLPELRYQPTLKHLTVRLGTDLVADTAHAMLVREPKRVVPTYAVSQGMCQRLSRLRHRGARLR